MTVRQLQLNDFAEKVLLRSFARPIPILVYEYLNSSLAMLIADLKKIDDIEFDLFTFSIVGQEGFLKRYMGIHPDDWHKYYPILIVFHRGEMTIRVVKMNSINHMKELLEHGRTQNPIW